MVHEIKSSKKFQGFCLVGALLCEVPRQAYIHRPLYCAHAHSYCHHHQAIV